MRATGRYDERIDAQLSDLYAGRFGTPSGKATRLPAAVEAEAAGGVFSEPMDVGPKGNMLHDDEDPDVALPFSDAVKRAGGPVGNVLRVGHGLPKVAVPAKAERVHDSKFIFRDISGRARNPARLYNPLVTSDFDGTTRLASNKETLYRSWATRYWVPSRGSPASTKNWPFPDADEDKPRPADGFRVPP